MTANNITEKKELFIGSELRPEVGVAKSGDTPQVDSSASNQEIQKAAVKTLEIDGSQFCSAEGQGDWESQKEWVLEAAEDVHCTILEGDAVLLNLDNGHYYSLNRVGTLVWEYCDGSHSLEEALTHLCDRFDVEEDRAKADLLAISSHLVNEQLLLKKGA